MQTSHLLNNVVLITGGAGGLGRAVSHRLATSGAHVVVADVNQAAADEIAEEVSGMGIHCDLQSSLSVDQCIETTMKRYGQIDALINCGAIHLQKRIVDITDDEFESIIKVNLTGAFFACRAAARVMSQLDRGGRIINIVTPLFANPLSAPYMASKYGLWGFTGCLAMELAKFQITVNAIAPGVIRGTGMEKWFIEKARLSGISQEQFDKAVEDSIPLGRTSSPDDVAGVIDFLCSDAARYITCELIHVTGGWKGYSQHLG
ncbi:MAG: SDR family NAD(P)-dependent oxidoreductase [Terracidiphilus sp.]|jgi:NAD(P)-dependent dehydrogenase (short-subunit alcohol dehydrogenase family)